MLNLEREAHPTLQIDHRTNLDVSKLGLTEDVILEIQNPVIRAAVTAAVEANTPVECKY